MERRSRFFDVCRLVAIMLGTLTVCAGCKSSTATISLADSDLRINTQQMLPSDTLPFGASADGKYLVLAGNISKFVGKLMIYDVDSRSTLAELPVAQKNLDWPIFSADGKSLFFREGDQRVAWNWSKNERRVTSTDTSDVPGGTESWNFNRTIGITQAPRDDKGNLSGTGTRAAFTSDGSVHRFLTSGFGGFDAFGRFWFKRDRNWVRLDRSGSEKAGGQPPKYLVTDQAKDRGSYHLHKTEVESKYDDAEAFLDCVWLSADNAVPRQGKDSIYDESAGRTALAYSGSDVWDYGFLPGRDEIYVVTVRGSFLVSFKKQPKAKQP